MVANGHTAMAGRATSFHAEATGSYWTLIRHNLLSGNVPNSGCEGQLSSNEITLFMANWQLYCVGR